MAKIKTLNLCVIGSGFQKGAVVTLTVGLFGKDLMEGKGYLRLAGHNKRIKHLTRRLYWEGPLPPITRGERLVFRSFKVWEEELEEILQTIKE
jgi:hypothetical protein